MDRDGGRCEARGFSEEGGLPPIRLDKMEVATCTNRQDEPGKACPGAKIDRHGYGAWEKWEELEGVVDVPPPDHLRGGQSDEVDDL